MLSAEYHAFESILRHSPRSEFDPMAGSLDIAKQMHASFQFDVIVSHPAQCQVKKQIYEYKEQTVETYWIYHRSGNINWNTDRILLYLHGGGYFLGDFQN
ncbi:unnamed protein product [Rotaria sordida]|uniref:Alpha/beta hydrolase fold-3 domain-containing protein n=2 Tax=Rotaria sordida TaxID=392033 RepID=A0A818RR08_9BILA|nr:unnamed protein product [Rotaria sordida]CAF3652881.1 unnamed protein product [Rotaria sordida]